MLVSRVPPFVLLYWNEPVAMFLDSGSWLLPRPVYLLSFVAVKVISLTMTPPVAA